MGLASGQDSAWFTEVNDVHIGEKDVVLPEVLPQLLWSVIQVTKDIIRRKNDMQLSYRDLFWTLRVKKLETDWVQGLDSLEFRD